MGLGDRLIGDNMMQEIEKRMKIITNELCPRMDALIREQQTTNNLLNQIFLELKELNK